MSMAKHTVIGGLCMALAAGAGYAQTTTTTPSTKSGAATSSPKSSALKSSDRNFIMDAARGGMAEVELGRMATQKGASDAVRSFGQRMVDDHGKANEELKTIANSKGVQLASGLDSATRKEQDRLQKLNGADFDREYMKHMVRDHEKDIKAFKSAAKSSDPDVQAFATKTLPTLEEHLNLAKSAETVAKNEKKAAR